MELESLVLNSFCFSCGQGSKRTLSIKRKLSKYCEFLYIREWIGNNDSKFYGKVVSTSACSNRSVLS